MSGPPTPIPLRSASSGGSGSGLPQKVFDVLLPPSGAARQRERDRVRERGRENATNPNSKRGSNTDAHAAAGTLQSAHAIRFEGGTPTATAYHSTPPAAAAAAASRRRYSISSSHRERERGITPCFLCSCFQVHLKLSKKCCVLESAPEIHTIIEILS